VAGAPDDERVVGEVGRRRLDDEGVGLAEGGERTGLRRDVTDPHGPPLTTGTRRAVGGRGCVAVRGVVLRELVGAAREGRGGGRRGGDAAETQDRAPAQLVVE
jgi:hypothetical protein